ncbi:hypothetical protein DFQ28_005350 [Apophysomyces sp. BC1034]|nr:hypothetical protein DFQ30_005212 [Apophysomyces sp. BC1015]KAG0177861.1 hypothetical protein DFQ29_004258 [Apophysomyces sp. BC1021]KAG0188121.1 hypothetical protein DFQ28_005350 [Apophysomyces sp. BC1034]
MSDKCNTTTCDLVPYNRKFHRNESSTNIDLHYQVNHTYIDGNQVLMEAELDTVTLLDKFTFPSHLIGEAIEVNYPMGGGPVAAARIGVGDYGGLLKNMIPQPPPGKRLYPRAGGDDRYSTGGGGGSGSPNFRKRDVNSRFYWVLGIDPTMYYGAVYDLPLVIPPNNQTPFWKLPFIGFQLEREGGHRKQRRFFPTAAGSFGQIYSSTPYIVVPSEMAKQLNRAIGATFNKEANMYTISCAARRSAPALIFQFPGLDAKILPRQYIYAFDTVPSGTHHRCYSTIVTGFDNTNVLLGGPFFTSFYIIYGYDTRKVGLANSITKLGFLHPRGEIPTESGAQSSISYPILPTISRNTTSQSSSSMVATTTTPAKMAFMTRAAQMHQYTLPFFAM